MAPAGSSLFPATLQVGEKVRTAELGKHELQLLMKLCPSEHSQGGLLAGRHCVRHSSRARRDSANVHTTETSQETIHCDSSVTLGRTT